MNILTKYEEFCKSRNVPFADYPSVRSYDSTTLFCPAGMQQYKDKFQDLNFTSTLANNQSCIRLTDFDAIGDGTHLGTFNMLGLFSFRDWSLQKAMEFWHTFITKELNIPIEYITVHPKCEHWIDMWMELNEYIEFKLDPDCEWGDGNVKGYCTELYSEGIEIGNIVNPLGTCIDVGFGLERLDKLVNTPPVQCREVELGLIATKIIEAGYKPSNKAQGYVLRKILRELASVRFPHANKISSFIEEETKRQERLQLKYNKLKDKHLDKSAAWWFDTHGIDITCLK